MVAGAAAGATAVITSSSDAAPTTNQSPIDILTGFAPVETTRRGEMLYRKLGRTGVEVSLIGMGGFHVGLIKDEEESIGLVRKAIDRGITFMDNCWDYNDGKSEQRMGKALMDGYRDKVFLMTKFDGRNKKTAMKQIEESLKRLRTDHVDLAQHHEIIRMDDGDRIFAADGAHEAAMEAQKSGKVRFVGFTGHKDPSIHLRMLDVAEAHGWTPDTVQLPLNVMDAHFRSFAVQVLPRLVEKNIGVLGMKSFGDNFILRSKTASAIECLHYSMSLPTSVVITGIDKQEVLDQAFEAVKTWQPLSRDQMAAILQKTVQAAASGEFEKFKVSPHFDGTMKHPEWLGDVSES